MTLKDKEIKDGIRTSRGVIHTKHIKQFLKELKEEYKKKLCKTAFVTNSRTNKSIKYVAFEQFEEVLNIISGYGDLE